MTSLVAEIPYYVQTENPKGIKATAGRLLKLLNLDFDLSDLSERSDEFERSMSRVVAKKPKLAEQIRELEASYDEEEFSESGEFERWLKQHGVDKL
jgi:hypothetical protein